MAALRKPSGSRAGRRSCSSGRLDGRLLDDDRVCGAAARPGPRRRARRGAARPAAGGGGAGGDVERLGRARLSAGTDAPRARAQTAAGRGEHGELGRAAVHLGGVVADDRDPRPGLDQSGPRRYGVLPEDRRADDEHDIVWRERLRAAAAGRPVGCRRRAGDPAGTRLALRTTPARPGTTSRSASADQRGPGLGIVGARAGDDRRGREPRSARPARSTRAASAARARTTRCRRRIARRPSRRRPAQSSIGTITSAGPRRGHRLV